MITPAFSLTAIERVLPRLALDFTTAIADPRVTTTRALNTATRVNSSGLIEIVNANLPRYDFDPVTKVCLGQLIEETRANLLTGSNDFSATYWPVATNIVVDTDNALSPDGTTNADKVTDNTTTNVQHRLYRDYTFAAGAYTLSMYLKKDTHTWVRLLIFDGAAVKYANFNLATGAAGYANTGATSSIRDAGNGYYRCLLTVTAAGGAGNIQLVMLNADTIGSPATYTGTGTSFWSYGAQLETGAFATSYIPTTTTSLTRNADVVTMTGTNFSDWFNASEGAFGVQVLCANDIDNAYYVSANNGTLSEFMGLRRYTTRITTALIVDNGATVLDLVPTGTFTLNTPFKATLAYKLNNCATAVLGNTPSTDTSVTIPTVDRLNIGGRNGGANPLNGWVQQLQYWPQRIINAETQAFSK